MAEDNTLKEKLIENAQAPAFMQDGEKSVRQHDLESVIEADRYIRGLNAQTNKTLGVMYRYTKPNTEI